MAPKLDEFLSTFGVDICKPDEAASVEMTDYIDYLFVGYTVTGKMETENVMSMRVTLFPRISSARFVSTAPPISKRSDKGQRKLPLPKNANKR